MIIKKVQGVVIQVWHAFMSPVAYGDLQHAIQYRRKTRSAGEQTPEEVAWSSTWNDDISTIQQISKAMAWLPLSSVLEEYKVMKVKTLIALKESRDSR